MEPLEIMNPAANLSLSASLNRIKALSILTGLLLFFSSHAQHQMRGLVFEDERYNGLMLPSHYGKIEDVPLRASMKEFLPRVITQVSSNTAVTWSLLWYAQAILDAKGTAAGADDADPTHRALSPAFTYRSIQHKAGCFEPVSLIDALRSFQSLGSPRFSDYPEFCADSLSATLSRMAAAHKLPGYVRLFNSYDSPETKIHAMKKALRSGFPVVIGMICPPSFQFAGEFWQPREEEPLRTYGGHALCVFGYDDVKFGGAFEMANSWGTRWGKDGMTWMTYGAFGRHALYAFQVLAPGTPLEASVVFHGGDGNAMPVSKSGASTYAIKNVCKTGDPFKLSIQTRKGIFCSVIAVDAAGQSGLLFPSDSVTYSFVSRSLVLPNAADYYTLTEPAGKNILYFIFSANQEHLEHRVRRMLKGEIPGPPDPDMIKWVPDVVQFESSAETVVVAVELEQR